jgi:trehalose-phosphatase
MRSPAIPTNLSVQLIAEKEAAFPKMRTSIATVKAEEARVAAKSPESPRLAFRAWPEIRDRLRAANRGAVLLDFDGTLVNLRRRPSDVRMPARVKQILQRLVLHTNVFVAIVSGRRVQTLRRLIDVEGLHYFGLHGGERDDRSTSLTEKARVALEGAKHAVRLDFGIIPGIWIEDKELSFSVHHPELDSIASECGKAVLLNLLAPWGDALHVLNGNRVWEVLPREIPGKSSAIAEVRRELPAGATIIYIGDDGTDEMAFAVLPDQITVRVGRDPQTCARFLLRAPADVLRFLERLEKELP